MRFIDSGSAEKHKTIKLDTTKPMICLVCVQQITPKNAYMFTEPDIFDNDPNEEKTISSAEVRYYKCSCYENQSKIYFPYKAGVVHTMEEKNDGTPILTLDLGKEFSPETPLSDTTPADTVKTKTFYYYDRFKRQNNNDTDTDLHLIKASNILVDDYIRNYPQVPDKAKENAILEYPRVIKLLNTLSLLALMCGIWETPFGTRYGRVCDPFNASIPDLLIYSGSPFWEFVKETFLQSALTTSKVLIDRHDDLNKGGKYNPIKGTRNNIDHPNLSFDDQDSKNYIDLL